MRHDEIIRKAIELGRMSGFVTFDQLNELLLNGLSPSTTMTPEEIEVILKALNDEGINIVEDG